MRTEADEKFVTGISQCNSGCCVTDLVPVKLGKLSLSSYLRVFCLLFNTIESQSLLSQIMDLTFFLLVVGMCKDW